MFNINYSFETYSTPSNAIMKRKAGNETFIILTISTFAMLYIILYMNCTVKMTLENMYKLNKWINIKRVLGKNCF